MYFFIAKVSIPLWFDYNSLLKFKEDVWRTVSIPLWFDYNWTIGMAQELISQGSLNSTMVRLQQTCVRESNFSLFCLNSTMVRLQLGTICFLLFVISKSQFHYGSITTEYRTQNGSIIKGVSIPLWFDYNQ